MKSNADVVFARLDTRSVNAAASASLVARNSTIISALRFLVSLLKLERRIGGADDFFLFLSLTILS